MPDFVVGNLPSWLAVGVGLVALTIAIFAFRRPLSHTAFRDEWNVQYLNDGNFLVEVVIEVAPVGSSFMITDTECKLLFNKAAYILESGVEHIGTAMEGARALRLQFVGEDYSRLPGDLNKVVAVISVKLIDGSKKRTRRRISSATLSPR